MLLNVPAGVTELVDDGGNPIPIVNGQVSVEPHLVPALLASGYTQVGPDSNTSDAPEFTGDTALPSE